MKKYHRLLNFTSGTTTVKECIGAVMHSRDTYDYVSDYHKEIKKLFGVDYAYSFAAGRMALYVILQAIGVKQDDEVILQGYTCSVVPKTIMYLGAKPIYADIRKDDYNLKFEDVQRKISSRTKAVIVQHTYGIPCHDIYKIKELCKKNNIYMIEDCAHLFSQDYEGKKLGTIGDVAFFSTDHTKYISTSVGGVAITNNKYIGNMLERIYISVAELNRKEKQAIVFQLCMMNIMRNKYIYYFFNLGYYFRVLEDLIWRFFKRCKLLFYMDDYSEMQLPQYTFPARLSNVQAMIGLSQIKNLKTISTYRKKLTQLYKEQLREFNVISEYCEDVLRLPVLVDNPEKLRQYMKGLLRIESWFSPQLVCISKEEFVKFNYDEAQCPNAKYVAERIVNFPVHLKISEEEVAEICRRIQQYLKDSQNG